jgi:hypothetical protein
MNVMELKSDIQHLIDHVNDEGILNAIKVILSKQTWVSKDWGDMLSDDLRSELEASISEADQGKVVGHEEAMKQIRSRYNL